MRQSLKGHGECAIPCDHLLVVDVEYILDCEYGAISDLLHICRLVKLPQVSLRDLVLVVEHLIGLHVLVGLVVAEFLVCEVYIVEHEFVLGNCPTLLEDLEVPGEEHPTSGVEVADWQLHQNSLTSRRSRYEPIKHKF